MGVAQLQELAGVDQRITTTSGRVDGVEQGSWTEVYSSVDISEPVWLVSGESPDPSVSLPVETSVRLRTETQTPEAPVDMPEVRVPLLRLDHPELNAVIGWWTADEGVKARVDLAPQVAPSVSPTERYLHVQVVHSPGLGVLEGSWPLVSDSVQLSKLMRLNDTRLLQNGFDSASFDEDLTTDGYGLPVNVMDGGLKTDLSVVLDRSMEGHPAMEYALGASPTLSPTGGDAFRPADYQANVWAFPTAAISDPDTFYLSDRYGTAANPAGPNMGILWHYGRLWHEVSADHASPLVGIHPRVETPLWEENWLPYRQLNAGMFLNDLQHTNTPVMPVLSHLQMSFRLRSLQDGVDPETGAPTYLLQLEIKPLVGLWNPYNVGIEEDTYVIDTMMAPMVKLRIRRPLATEDEETTSWLRLIWSHGTNPIHTETSSTGRYFKLNIQDQDFQPGEVRLFSTDNVIQIMSNADNARMRDQINLIPEWNSSGAFVVNLQTTTTQTGFEQELIRVPEGTQVWFHDVYFQDSHHPDAQAWFNNPATPSTQRIHPDSSMSWLTLKARGGTGIFMSRYTGIWNRGTIREAAGASPVTVPERIQGSSANRDPRPVETLTSGDHHIGTWAFHLRTSTQMEDPPQRIRGWVDADPRALIGSSRWDGARDFDSEEGWNFIGAFMGGSLNSPSISDGEGGNRGLVAVGGFGYQAPQSDGSSRYRGYIGGSNTPVGGHTHVPLFDIPTSPLVSIGQFQHAQLGRYSYEPGYVLGNSYANVRIPLDQTDAENFNSITGLRLEDISYHVNQRVWDRYFFSTLAPDYVGG
ncbi:MAG: hypothetical protein PF795_15275 [Kiritimatiellae bacterium]|nr:hypothetical protein [Kiritimatiellia bacterium]